MILITSLFLNVGSDCKIDNVQGEIHSENNFASALYLLKHRKNQSQQAQIFFNKADVQSPLELQPDASGDVGLIINQSTIKNRGKKIENENESDRNSFYFGLSDPLSIIKIEEHPFEISNTTVSLGENDVFHFYPDDSKKEIKINNSSFTGKFEWVNKKYSDAQKLEIIISNSIFNRANVLHNNLDGDVKIEISASEINGLLACDNLEKVSNSFIQDSTLAYNVRVVEDCFLKDYEAPANVKAILGFNSEKNKCEEVQPIAAKMLEEPDLL